MDVPMSLFESLVEDSSLTPRQLEALQSYLRVVLGEIKYKEAAVSGTSKPVTIGSYFRTVQQARDNIRKSVVTLLIGLWLGLVKPDDVRRLLEVSGGSIRELSDEERGRFLQVLRVLIQKIVM